VTSLQQVHAQTLITAQAAIQAGAVLNWLGNVVLPQFKALPDPRSGLLNSAGGIISGIEHAASDLSGTVSGAAAANATSAADTVARSYLTALNTYLAEANNNLPTSTGAVAGDPAINTQMQLAPLPSGAGARSVAGTVNGRTGNPGSVSGRGATSKVGSTTTPAGSRATSGTGGGSPAPSSGSPTALPGSLQSVPAPPGTGISSSQVVPGGPVSGIGEVGSATGAVTANPSLPGLAVPGLSTGGYATQPGSPGVAAGEMMPGVANAPLVSGAAGSQDAAAANGAGGASADDMGGFPMMGGAAPGQSEKERRRQAWMNEDEDIWGVPTGCVPTVIEGTDWIWKQK